MIKEKVKILDADKITTVLLQGIFCQQEISVKSFILDLSLLPNGLNIYIWTK